MDNLVGNMKLSSNGVPDANSNTSNTETYLSNHSSRSQLDIEQDVARNNDDDEDDLPPIGTYLSGVYFWCKFAVWPFVFLVLNGIIVTTLVVFDEYQFRYGRHRRHHMYDIDIYPSYNRMENVRFEMMKYNRIVITILLLVDALILYYAVKFMEKKVREADMIGEIDDDQQNPSSAIPNGGTNSVTLKPNVHAQVSRKLDTVLGRGPQPRVSILISMLWLLFVGCGSVGIVSLADWLFAISPKAKKVCMSSSKSGFNFTSSSDDDGKGNNNNNNDDVYDRSSTAKPIANIPDKLQEWAQTRHDWYSSTAGLIHLSNGTTFFAASNPLNANKTSERMEYMYGIVETQLVSTDTNGTIRFFDNVVDPRSFVSVTGESELNSDGFCCLFKKPFPRSDNDYMDFTDYNSGYSVLCVQPSDDISTGVFKNISLYESSKSSNPYSMVSRNFDGASIIPFNNALWIQKIFSVYDNRNGNMKTQMEFYNITLDNMIEANLKLVTKTENAGYNYNEGFDEPFMLGPGSPCYRWTKYIDLCVMVIVLTSASAWLLLVKNLSVGVVPACVAVSFLLTRLNNDLAIAVCSLIAGAAFIGLLGFIPIPLSREKLVWGLYTLLAAIGGMIFAGRFYMYYEGIHNFERALVTISLISLVGFILNHPVLYLFGWVGGIWAVFCGIFLLFTPQRNEGLFAIILGFLMGSGCVTIGFHLIKYRAHLMFYTKRAWAAMNNAMNQSNSGSRNNYQRNQTAAPRYTPVLHTSPESPIRAPTRGRDENDITAGLLNQRSDGSGRIS